MDLNHKKTGIEKRFCDLAQKVVADAGYTLYDVEYISGSTTLRLFIMDPATKSAQLEDCVKVDRAFDPYMEEEWIPEGIILEVSSPGIFRKIRTLEHIAMSLNEWVEVVLSGKVTDDMLVGPDTKLLGKNKLRGLLGPVEDGKLVLNIDDNKLLIPFDKIKKASLDPEI